MKPRLEQRPPLDVSQQREQWEREYRAQLDEDRQIRNRSGVELRPLYTPLDWNPEQYLSDVGFPGHEPFARGIYPTMHRGRTWSQRQLVGLGVPQDYNRRVRSLQEAGTNAISLLPCNSVFRGYDCDEVPLALLGTCGTVINCVEHMEQCLEGVPFERISTALNDPSPFTLLAFLLVAARRRNVPWSAISGTSNQSDYLSHCVANHMFFRLALPAARRILTDHIDFCSTNLPKWNPISVVGQHMQQAGATPAEAMGLTLSSALQIASDCIERGLQPDQILPRFSFFFDISISFFEEIAKFRAGRRVWARVTKEQLGARDPRSWRFKFHGQTSGADLTLQQPLNNIARVTAQAIAGILSGLQSMHTDAWDEAIATPAEEAARIAIATQNILRHEAGLCDVIDPLGGSYYIETLTNQMESEILAVMDRIAAAGGMYRAVESGVVQRMVGQSALAHQRKLDSGEYKQVGVNCFQAPGSCSEVSAPERPDRASIEQCVRAFREHKAARSRSAVSSALDALAVAINSNDQNVFAAVVVAVESGVTHGEVVACLRREAGFGTPVVAA